MAASPSSPSHDGYFIRVNVHESRDFALSVPAVALRIFSQTTALEVCKMVTHKLKLPSNRVGETSLILVSTLGSEGASTVHQQLHTLGDIEKPVELQLKAVRKYRDSNPDSSLSVSSNTEGVCRWFFRDARSTPLDLEHDTSGSEHSEDEEISRNPPWDIAHLNEDNCTRCAGFLLKKSSRDPNLWRKRFCILAGDKLWFMKRRPQRSRGQLVAATALLLVSARVKESNPRVPFGFDLHTVERAYQFRAFGRHAKKDQLLQVQRGWIQALTGQIAISDENDMISIAEHIICDSEGSSARRVQKSMSAALGRASCVSPHTPRSDLAACRVVVSDRTRRTRFVMAVELFKSKVCRERSIREQWRAARRIFDEFLRKQSTLRCLDAPVLGRAEGSPSIDDAIGRLKLVQEGLNTTITEGVSGGYGSDESPAALFDALWEDAVESLGLCTRHPSAHGHS